MSVSLTLSLPDLQPDTIRAAFDALLPPRVADLAPPVEPVTPSEPEPVEAPAEPTEPEPTEAPAEHPLLRAVHAAIAEQVATSVETSVSVTWQGLPRVNVGPLDFRRICGGLSASVAYGGWVVVRDGVEWASYLGDCASKTAVVPLPEVDAAEPEPEVAPGGPPPAPWQKDPNDVPF